MAKRLITGVFALVLGGGAAVLTAETLPDPTRPPAEAGLAGSAVAAVASGPMLQSVMIAPGRRSAVISGQLLTEGALFGEAKLVRIAEGEVVLSGPDGQQTLRLFPDVEKHVALPPQAQPVNLSKPKSKRKTEQKAP